MAAFLGVALLASSCVWLGSLWATRNAFEGYVSKQNLARASSLADSLGEYYRLGGTRDSAVRLLARGSRHHGKGMGRAQERIVLFDEQGDVLLDTDPGLPEASSLKAGAAEIVVAERTVGSVAVLTPRVSPGGLGGIEGEFLSRTEQALRLISVLSAAFALVLGLRLSSGLAKPVESLERAATRLADGYLGEQVGATYDRSPPEIRKLVEAFNRMSSELRRTNTEKKEMLRDLAHDIRTPLTVLRGNLEAASLGCETLDGDSLSSMLEEVERLSDLVNNLSALDGMGALTLEPVLPETLVNRAFAAVRGAGTKEGLKVLISLEEGLSAVSADPQGVARIFSNLLSNALRYTPRPGTVEVGAARHSPLYISFWVKDTGPGIEPSDLERVFDRFYRGDPSRTRATGGTGLGLAIAKELAENMGGTIWAENRPSGGAAFYFTLPLASPTN